MQTYNVYIVPQASIYQNVYLKRTSMSMYMYWYTCMYIFSSQPKELKQSGTNVLKKKNEVIYMYVMYTDYCYKKNHFGLLISVG